MAERPTVPLRGLVHVAPDLGSHLLGYPIPCTTEASQSPRGAPRCRPPGARAQRRGGVAAGCRLPLLPLRVERTRHSVSGACGRTSRLCSASSCQRPSTRACASCSRTWRTSRSERALVASGKLLTGTLRALVYNVRVGMTLANVTHAYAVRHIDLRPKAAGNVDRSMSGEVQHVPCFYVEDCSVGSHGGAAHTCARARCDIGAHEATLHLERSGGSLWVFMSKLNRNLAAFARTKHLP